MRIWQYLKEPGSIRILIGSINVGLLLIFAFFGSFLSPYQANEMDTEAIMAPPSINWLKSFLVTDKALNNLGLNKPKDAGGGEDNGELDYLSAESSSDEESFYEDDLSFLESEEEDKAKAQIEEGSQKKSIHYFGTDKDGRDILALLIAGSKTCIIPGLLACLISLGLGIPMGIMGGYYGGLWAEAVKMYNGIILSFPRFVLILIVICALEPNVYYTMIVLGLTIAPRISELMRTRVASLSRQGFILAAKESGLSDFKIMVRHLFWYQNRTLFFIQASLVMAESILIETTLSYLQFGTKPPDVSWGNIIEGSRMSFFSEYYWITFFPAVAIVVSILGFYYLGDGLNARREYHEQR